MKRYRLSAILAALALLVAACGSNSADTAATAGGDTAATPSGSDAVTSAESSADASDPFPAFVGTTTEGDAFDLEAFRGTDIVLWFWAPW